jgi:probable phosphoglycerate mutase
MTTILYLVRHGETDWNATGRWQGHTDVPLNERGLQQARLLAQRLQREGVRFDAIYSSDLTRAYQTAWEIGSLLRVAVQLWPPLREIDMGEWSGLTREEIRARYPDDYARLERGEDLRRGKTGETKAAMHQRVTHSIEAMVAQHPDETLALVTHGGPVRALIRYVNERYGGSVPFPNQIGNTSLTILTCHSYMWEITACNDLRHVQPPDSQSALVTAPPDDAEQPGEGYIV